jgi:CDP-paratose 2-epimerase
LRISDRMGSTGANEVYAGMKTILITGAAGFVGNAACARYRDEYHVIAVDDMSRPTAKRPEGVVCCECDAAEFVIGLSGVDIVIHLAAQVSVTESIKDPWGDVTRNALVTLQLAEWASKLKPLPIFIYANTNKVFGELKGVTSPILDSQPIAPSTPYGISKATGGMYVREFLLDTGFDFRQSCIFSQHQVGTVDQGWVGYVARQIREERPVVCYGDGKQVRDLLHVEDLLDAYDMAIDGQLEPGSYNIGGGEQNAYSFEEAVRLMGGFIVGWEPARPRDQHCCILAADKLRERWWYPKIAARDVLIHMGVGERAA